MNAQQKRQSMFDNYPKMTEEEQYIHRHAIKRAKSTVAMWKARAQKAANTRKEREISYE